MKMTHFRAKFLEKNAPSTYRIHIYVMSDKIFRGSMDFAIGMPSNRHRLNEITNHR